MLSVSAVLALTGCGSEGVQSNSQLVGGTPPPPPPPPPSNKGKVFHTGFMQNYDTPDKLAFYISSDVDTDVNITFSDDGSMVTEHITANMAKEVVIDDRMMQIGTGTENKMIEISATENIVVVGLNQLQYTTDAFLSLPDRILSTEYYVAGYQNIMDDEFSVIAIEDNTAVNYRLPDGTSGSVTLNKGETYQYQYTGELMGTHISSDKNIAVLSGNQCTDVPDDASACDHIVEQMLPVDTWEKTFITVPLATRIGGDTFRFVASVDGTQIKVDGTVVATLDAGKYHEMIIDGSKYIEANHPIMALQYSNGSTYDDVTSDPFMAIVPAINQFDTEHIIQTPTGFTDYVNIVAPTANVGDIMMDGAAIASSEFTTVPGNTSFSTAQIQIDEGSHDFTSSVPFGLLGYGFADYDSYGYPSSLRLTKH